MPSAVFNRLTELNRDIHDLNGVVSLLGWDQETYMPAKGLGMRARQIKTISSILHTRKTDAEIGRLLDALQSSSVDAQLTDLERACVREQRYDFERQRKLPVALVSRLAETTSLATEGWRQAREQSDFSIFLPHLEKVIDLLRQQAEAYGYAESPYDALIEDYERGMTAARIRPTFERLRTHLSKMIRAIADADIRPRKDVLHRHYDSLRQWEFGLRILKDMGFDFEAGRQDRSAHPFTSGTYSSDIRLTTRIDEHSLSSGLFSSMHEGGHGLYEQGFQEQHADTILAASPSLGLHESQSRLWENQVGRSMPFWRHYFPAAREIFPESLGDIGVEDFYRAINTVEPSLIRVEANEATYPLHIILRFEIEEGLITGAIAPKDLPEIWNAKMQELLGITPPDDARGVLQDIHWSHGLVGYFPTYAIGNLYAAQIFRQMRKDMPELESAIQEGKLIQVRDYLSRKIYAAGRTMLADDLIRSVCGEGLNEKPFLEYLAIKFGAIYGINLNDMQAHS